MYKDNQKIYAKLYDGLSYDAQNILHKQGQFSDTILELITHNLMFYLYSKPTRMNNSSQYELFSSKEVEASLNEKMHDLSNYIKQLCSSFDPHTKNYKLNREIYDFENVHEENREKTYHCIETIKEFDFVKENQPFQAYLEDINFYKKY